jgi:metal-responsive CopG/Arc/MetJ family transcriptional regulator
MYTVCHSGGAAMGKRVVLELNQQQLELIDRTIAKGVAADRESLIRLALREYAERHGK